MAASDLLLQLFPPDTELFLRRRTETRAKGIFRGELQEPVQDLFHSALRSSIRQAIDFLPVRLHFGPHQQLETLHEFVISRTARHRRSAGDDAQSASGISWAGGQ